jgi:hypothetical protein
LALAPTATTRLIFSFQFRKVTFRLHAIYSQRDPRYSQRQSFSRGCKERKLCFPGNPVIMMTETHAIPSFVLRTKKERQTQDFKQQCSTFRGKKIYGLATADVWHQHVGHSAFALIPLVAVLITRRPGFEGRFLTWGRVS